MADLRNQHLQQFAQQLATWTKEIIEHGRTPFRRVDTYPHIETEQGGLQPPLVFWINRQSMMAGGILLLPDGNLAAELEHGRNCASALGLHHFVTWETDRVRIWQVDNDQIKEHQSFPLSSPSHPETFRYLLADILDSLKLLAVLGAIPVTDLSPHYFNNLFQATLQQALPPLIKAYRRQRSEMESPSTEDADTCANEANRLLILQVISLVWFEKFPETILPERMNRAIELSLPALPERLQHALSYKTTIEPPPLPLETAVCFHHLLLRLRQLSWRQAPERAKESIYNLTHSWYQNETENREPAAIHLYPVAPPLSVETTILLSDSPSLLAATALLADISNLGQHKLSLGNLFQFDRHSFSSQAIVGRLLNRTRIASLERYEFTARLRISWPNRHLKIKTGQPFWLWELIHLLGLCHKGQKLSLELPIDLLKKPEHVAAWSLLCENFSFQQIQLLENGNIQLGASHSEERDQSFQLHLLEEVREVAPSADAKEFRNQLLFALTLPRDIYNLLGEELIWPVFGGIPRDHFPGWKIYCQSQLYKWFRNILYNKPFQMESENEVSIDASQSEIPYPEPFLLNELTHFEGGVVTDREFTSIDHFLANLLACPAVENIERSNIAKIPKQTTLGGYSGKKLKETIAEQLSNHGIPNFPEQYLYFLDQPEICHYTVTPPLKLKSSLLGQFELEDTKGQTLVGYGEELEQTLLFCSAAGKTEFDLPKDRRQLEQLLSYYKKDLNSLYKHLNNLCYSQIEDSQSAQKLIKKTWKNLTLPAPSWFKN
ncbi:MAG: hypothetical protein QNK27_12875 [Desulfuromusa sp.]|nr:hypothetical protein [Desulfuromusa sp.]